MPFLLDVQSDALSVLASRAVVPLHHPEALHAKAMTRLTNMVTVEDRPLIAMVPEMTGLPQRNLGTIVGDLSAMRHELQQAADLLLTGF